MSNILVGVDKGSAEFDAAAGTITFSDLGTVQLEQIRLITNVTDNKIIYQFNKPSLGGPIASNVLTLTFDTSSMDDADNLAIDFNIGEVTTDYDLQAQRTATITPAWAKQLPAQSLVTDSDIGVSNTDWIKQGNTVSAENFTTLTIFLSFTEGTAADRAEFKILAKKTEDDLISYDLPLKGQQTYCFPNQSETVVLTYNISNTLSYLDIQTRAALIGSPASTISIDYALGYGASAESVSPPVVITDTKDNDSVGFYFTEPEGTPPNALLNPVAIDDTTITLSSAVTLPVGTTIGIFSGGSGENRFYFGNLTTVATATATLLLDAPLDFAFSAGDTVIFLSREMNVDASGAAVNERDFEVNVGATSGLEIDIHRITGTMIVATQPNDGLFGDLPSLLNGMTFSRKNGIIKNTFTVHNNDEIAIEGFDLIYTDRTTPSTVWGVRFRITFGGEDKRGTVFRLRSGEGLRIKLRDDISGLVSFRVQAQGHIRSTGE